MRNRYAFNDLAGCVQQRRARENGVLVGVYDALDSGVESGDPEAPWLTVCEEHNRLVGHRTLALAKYHAVNPTGWCEPCRHLQDGHCDECSQPIIGPLPYAASTGFVCSCECHEASGTLADMGGTDK